MFTRQWQRIVAISMAMIITFASIGSDTVSPPAQAESRLRTLTTTQTDMAAHAIGSEWHNSNTLPQVVDFGPLPKSNTVGGMDQWLNAQQPKSAPVAKPKAGVNGKNRALIIRVHFSDATQRLSNAQLQSNWLDPLNSHFKTISNGKNTGWDFDIYGPVNVSARSDYILSNNQLYREDNPATANNEAVDNSQKLVNAVIAKSVESDLEPLIEAADTIILLMDNASQNRLRGVNYPSREYDFPYPDIADDVNTVYMDEGGMTTDPTSLDTYMWGVLAHEMGHALQAYAGFGDHWTYGHPSNYRNAFELMDSNLPGHVSANLKTYTFASWLPNSHIIDINNTSSTQKPSDMGYCLRAIEYDPALYVTPQILRVRITGSVNYLISAHRPVNGDELQPIPDVGGILIERVVSSGMTQWEDLDNDGAVDGNETLDQKVVVRGLAAAGTAANRNKLWPAGTTFNDSTDGRIGANATDGITIAVTSKPNDDTWCVRVSYGAAALQPDVGIYPWRQPPGETYETTDIWVDSPLNGYGVYRYGSWNDLSGLPVPRGNGDDPAIGSINRVYARVRNFGTANAVNVKVKFKVTDPLGVGMQNSNWALIGDGQTVTSAQFPALASIPPGGFVDVYKEWTPNPTLTAEQQAAGVFYFHSCIRVEIETVAGESITGNQDGDSEQENIQNFEATPTRSPIFDHSFDIINNQNTNRIINIFQKNNLPEGWEIRINDGDSAIGVPALANVTVPVSVTATGASVIGSSFTVQFTAAEPKLLQNSDAVEPTHPTIAELGGFDFTVNVLADTQIACKAYKSGYFIEVVGSLDGFEGIHQAGTPLRAYALISGEVNGTSVAIPLDDRASGNVGVDGDFRMRFSARSDNKGQTTPLEPKNVRCVFPGTHLLASSSTPKQALINTVPPTMTQVPWAASQFHSSLALNAHQAPLTAYSDRVFGAPVANSFNCVLIYCPVLYPGVHGRSAQFESSRFSFLQSQNPINLTTNFSVGMWVKRSRNNTQEILISHGNSLASGQLFSMGFTAANKFFCSTYNDELASTTLFNDRDWHHVACVVDGNNRSLYVDGSLENTSASPFPAYSQNAKMTLAWRADGMPSFNGQIDEVRIYTIPIGLATLAYLSNDPFIDPIAPLPVSALSFDDIAIPEMNSVIASCGGQTCPVVYYPDRQVVPRPLERVASITLEPGHFISYSSTAPVIAGTDSTLMFWAHLDNSYLWLRPLATQNTVNRPTVYWHGSTQTLSFASLSYAWGADAVNPFTSGWHFFAFVKNANTLQIYIDGNKVAEGPALPALQPFRVGVGQILAMGGAQSGEMAAVELSNFALPGAQIAQQYAGNFPRDAISPTRTFTITPTASSTPVPAITIPASNQLRTAVAAAATAKARATLMAAPNATNTRLASLNGTSMALAATQWANLAKTDSAMGSKTPVASKIPVVTKFIPFPTFVVIKSPTVNLTHTRTNTATATRTWTASTTATATATASKSATATATLPGRTKINTPTDQATITKSPTTTNTASATKAANITYTATRTATRTATASRTFTVTLTATPGVFGKWMIPVSQLPQGMLYRALQHIADAQLNVAPDWNTPFIGDVAVPMYRPDVDSGNTPAYYELAVFADAGKSKPAGFIIMANPMDPTTPHDFPIAHWNSTGSSISSQALAKITKRISTDGLSEYKLYKLDTLSYVIVQNDAVISSLGAIPALIDGLTTNNFNYYSDPSRSLSSSTWSPGTTTTSDDNFKPNSMPTPIYSGPSKSEASKVWKYVEFDMNSGFSNYASRYTASFAPLIAQQADEASPLWKYENKVFNAAEQGFNDFHIPVPANATTQIVLPVQGITIKNISSEFGANELMAYTLTSQTIAGYPVLAITTGGMPTDKLSRLRLNITAPNSTLTAAKFTIYLTGKSTAATRANRGWSAWTQYTAGTSNDQRDYDQYTVPGSCASGCGPTAWMMLFGWADYRSSIAGSGWSRYNAYRHTGGVYGLHALGSGSTIVAPKTMDTNVRNAILYIRNQVGTFCWDGSGATTPWDMDDARYYLNYVGTGMGFDTHYNVVGIHEDSIARYAMSHLTHSTDRRPVVIGVGWLTHYPLAWKVNYRSRPEDWNEGWFDGDDVVWDTQWYVNQGWGGSGNGWVSGGIWFAGRISR